MRQKLLLFIIIFVCSFAHANIIYVKSGSSGDGTSWSQAFGDLQLALQQATVGDQIWVAQGTYYPSSSLDASASFVFKNGIKMYGGFIGTETLLIERADFSGRTTVLSGQLSDNVQSKIILKILQATHPDNIIDGFTIQNASRSILNGEDGGAGIQIIGSVLTLKNSIIKDNVLRATDYTPMNDARAGGAGIFSRSSQVVLLKTHILSNELINTKAANNGGVGFAYGAGIYAEGGGMTLIDCTIQENKLNYTGFAGFGAGAYFMAMQKVDIFKNLVAFNAAQGSQILNLPSGGGLYFNSCPNVSIYGAIFHGNYTSNQWNDGFSSYGEGNAVSFQNTTAVVNQTTFGRNAKKEDLKTGYSDNAKGIYVSGPSHLSFNNTVFLQMITGQTALNQTFDYYRCVSKYPIGYSDDPENRWAEMEFVNPEAGDYTPLYCSRHLNFGDAQYVYSSTDMKNKTRIVGEGVDPGAIEFQHPGQYNRVYVDRSVTSDFNEGINWETAYATVQEALNCQCKDEQGVTFWPDEIWIAEGTYTTGNSKESTFLLNDGQKIYGGFSKDDDQLEDRDVTLQTKQTILSGLHKEGIRANHVVSSLFNYKETELNTLIIQDGQTKSEGSVEDMSGAGIFVRGQLTLKNLWVRNNNADGNFVEGPNSYQQHNGGGIFVYRFDGYGVHQHPKVPTGLIAENIKISNNTAGGLGAGISFVLHYNANRPENDFVSTFKNIEICNNQSKRNDDKFTNAGALHVEGHYNIELEDFVIDQNAAVTSSAIQVSNHEGSFINFKRGRITNNYELLGVNESARGYTLTFNTVGTPNTVNFENVLISNNRSKRGTFNAYQTNINLTNVTLAENQAEQYERLGYFMSAHLSLKNSIVSYPSSNLPLFGVNINQFSASASHTLFTEAMPAAIVDQGQNLESTPADFVSAATGDFHLLPTSAAIDQGNNTFLSATSVLDLDGNDRIYNQTVDMGVYEFNGTVSIQPVKDDLKWHLYPNPATDRTYLTFDRHENGTLQIFDALGKKVYEKKQLHVAAGQPLEIQVSSFAPGLYMIYWVGADAVYTTKLIKK